MARFVSGDIVIVPFPFSSEVGSKRRPALVLASWAFESSTDYLLALISSQPANDPYIMPIVQADFETGGLNKPSYIRPTYLFSVGEHRIDRAVCHLSEAALSKIYRVLRELFDPK